MPSLTWKESLITRTQEAWVLGESELLACCDYEPLNFTLWPLFFISIQLGIIKLDYLQVTLLLGHFIKWLKSGKIQNMLRYPSWISMHHVLVSVCIVKAWEHLDRWLASHRAGPRSVHVGLMLDLCFHHFRRETESELFYKMTGNPVMMGIDYLQHPLVMFVSYFSKLNRKWIWMEEGEIMSSEKFQFGNLDSRV